MFLNSVRNRLALLFFLITAAAVGFVYLYVVPQLRSSLTAEKLSRIERSLGDQAGRVESAMRAGISQPRLRTLLREIATRTDARVTVLGVRPGVSGPEPAFVVGDSQLERSAVAPDYPAAATAVLSPGRTASAVERVGGGELGQTAIALTRGAEPLWVVVFSTDLADVSDSVALIRRQILIAGTIAILAALTLAACAASKTPPRRWPTVTSRARSRWTPATRSASSP